MMTSNRTLLILIPLLPLLAAVITAILGPKLLRGRSHWPVILGIGGSVLCSLLLAGHVRSQVSDLQQSASETQGMGATPVGFEEVYTFWTWAWINDAYPQSAQPAPVGPNSAVPIGSTGGRDFRIDVALRIDPLTAIMLLMVTFISLLVAIYASGYMQGERGYWRFFAYVGLFVFSMTSLVSVSNFLLLFVFWEAVGVCSYLLIGFWYEKPSAAAAGMKAFLVNRVGDFGFALALFLIWTTYGTWNFHDTPAIAGVLGQSRLAAGGFVGGGLGLAICLLLMLGACGKSAQIPLHVWLPDAMEGPTPVSALIHAATMVTAGVYMVTRCTPLFLVSPTAQVTVACIGGSTALLAALIALTQFDLKRVLAYSTVSQLGFMFLGLGTGTLAGISAGMFHLLTHAFFKALLFLGSGSVMHAMGGVIDMRRFGGLRKRMPITSATFAIGCLALAGLFPLSGFWSKDAIVASVRDQGQAMQRALDERSSSDASATGEVTSVASYVNPRVPLVVRTHGEADHWMTVAHAAASTGGQQSSNHTAESDADHGHVALTTTHLGQFTSGELKCGAQVYPWLFRIALFCSLLTAIYTFRAFFLTFYGEERIPHEAGHHAHESPGSMWIPLVVLAAFAAGIGYVLESTHGFVDFLAFTPSLANRQARMTPAPGVFHMDVALISTAIAVIGIAVAAYLYLGSRREVASIASLLDRPWLGRPYQWSLHKFFIDEIYNFCIVKPLEGLAWLSYFIDRWVVDGLVNFCGWLPRVLGSWVRGLQMGFVPFYGLAMVVGMMLLVAARALWGGN